MELLAILGIAGLIIMLVGHGLWLAAAWLFRGGREAQDRGNYEPTLADDRTATFRYLDHLRIRGLIDSENYARMARLISEDARLQDSQSVGIRSRDNPVIWPREDSPAKATPSKPARPIVAEPESEPPLSAGIESLRKKSVEWKPADTFHSMPEPEPVVVHQAPSRKPLAEVLAGFMAEKNIRWGELVGGLLIVGCSIALVISLWAQIAAIPILKFVIFTAVTAGLFGAGLFVHHHWKLPATGYALLVISTLLVPLNILAFAAFSPPGVLGGFPLVAELAALALFGWLTYRSGQVVMPAMPLLFAGGVLVLSATSLAVRYLSPTDSSSIFATSLLPVGAYIFLMVASSRKFVRSQQIAEDSARVLVLQLTVLTFSCLVPMGLLVYESGDVSNTLRILSPILCALAMPANVLGTVLWRRLEGKGAMRVTSASISLTAAGVIALALFLGWPTPSRLIPTLILNGLIMTALCRLVRHPGFHVAAVTWFALAWVLGAHTVMGNLSWSESEPHMVIGALLSAMTGKSLVAVVLGCLVLAERFRRRSIAFANAYGLTAMVFAGISAALVTLYGFRLAGDAQHIIWVYLLYASGGFLAGGRFNSKFGVWCGCVMMQLALVQTLAYAWPLESMAWSTSLLIGATLCAVACGVLWKTSARSQIKEVYREPLTFFAIFVSMVATLLLFMMLPSQWHYGIAVRFAWVAALWASLSLINQWPALFAGAQMASTGAVFVGLQTYVRSLEWYQDLVHPAGEPWLWQIHFGAVAGIGLIWATLRHAVASHQDGRGEGNLEQRVWHTTATKLLNPSVPALDFWMVGISGLACIALSLWAALPAVFAEHGGQLSISQYRHAAGAGTWVLLFLIACSLALYYRGGLREAAHALLVLVGCGVALLAAQWAPPHGVTTAWRWFSAAAFLLISTFFWRRESRTVFETATRQSWTNGSSRFGEYKTISFLLFVVPLLLMTLSFSMALGRGFAIVAPEVGNVWLRLSLLGPISFVALTLMAYAIRDRKVSYSVATAGLLCASVTTVEICILHRAGGQLSTQLGIWLVQLNVILVLAVGGTWRVIQQAIHDDALPDFPRWTVQTARAALGGVFLMAATLLWLSPQFVSPVVMQAGTAWGIAATLLTLGMSFKTKGVATSFELERRMLPVLGAIAIACALAPWDTGNWLCFHALLIGLAVAGWIGLLDGAKELRRLGSGWQETFDAALARGADSTSEVNHELSCVQCSYNLRGLDPSGRCPECNARISDSVNSALNRLSPHWTGTMRSLRARTSSGVLACTLLVSVFALRGMWNDPGRPWWSSAALLVIAALCMTLAAWTPGRPFAYLAAFEVLLATTGWWLVQHWPAAGMASTADFVDLVNVNLIGIVATGAAWLWFERRLNPQEMYKGLSNRVLPFHHAATVFCAAILSALAGFTLYSAAVQAPVRANLLLTWSAWAGIVGLTAACLIRPALRQASVIFYIVGLAGLALTLGQLEMTTSALAWSISLALSGFVLLTTIAWRWGRASKPDSPLIQNADAWLRYANVTVTLISLLFAASTNFTHPDIKIRLLMILPALVGAASAWFLSVGPARQNLQTVAFGMLSAGAILFAWAWVPPEISGRSLLRAVALFSAASALIPIFGWASRRLDNSSPSLEAIRRVTYGLIALAGAAIFYVSGSEITSLLNRTALPLTHLATISMIVSLSLLIAATVAFALRPMLDPFREKESARGLYIYAGETLAAVLALHIRASMSWLFHGVISQYWPILIMGLAFAAVSIGEGCRRRGVQVLARPLGRTGVFLPALTALEFFLSASRMPFWTVLLTAGSFYAVLAGLRRSATLAVVAGVCMNGALWCFLHQIPGMGIAQHPQIWFIPPALAVLAAAHLNRKSLSEEERGTIRYACLIAIYLSSTADIFLAGVANAPWLPLVLAGLSVGGILFGIGFRIRSFLQLGTGFLCLSLLTIIWHAAANLGWTWVWYVAGIALGITIIAVFALFEKKRSEMIAVVENVRKWSK
jgi:hypothetical protein